jgi:hypothetical protein
MSLLISSRRWQNSTNFYAVVQPIQECVCPARLHVVGEEGAPDARVHGDKPLVFLPAVVLQQDLSIGPQVVAGVITLYYFHVRKSRNQLGRVGQPVEDKHEIGSAMDPFLDEEVQVFTTCGRIRKGIEYQRPFVLVR